MGKERIHKTDRKEKRKKRDEIRVGKNTKTEKKVYKLCAITFSSMAFNRSVNNSFLLH
jgi:hypothetical protein